MKRNLDEAYRVLSDLHKDQKRKGSGEPYEVHPKDVMALVEKYYLSPFTPEQQESSGMSGVDYKSNGYSFIVLCASLFHDAVEDSPHLKRRIDRLAGLLVFEDVCDPNEAMLIADLVHQVTSLDKLGPNAVRDQNRKLRKNLMRARVPFMSEAARVIKTCDRLDNTKNMDDLDEDFRPVYARESVDLFNALLVGFPKQCTRLKELVHERTRELILTHGKEK